MTYLLLSVLLLTGCTIKLVLPEQPLSTKLDSLIAGEDPLSNTIRVTNVPEQPRKVEQIFIQGNTEWACVVTSMDMGLYIPPNWPTRKGEAVCYQVWP